MKQIAARWCAALLLTTLATIAHAQDEAKQAIEAHYVAIAADLQAKKTDALDKAALPDAKGMDFLGKELPRDKWLTSVQERVAKIEMLKVIAEVREVVAKDDEATSITAIKATGEAAGNDGKQVPIELNFIDRTTWAKADGGWKIKLNKLVSSDGKLNNRTIRNTFLPEADAARKDIQAYYDGLSDLYGKKEFDTLTKAATASADVDIRDASGNKLTGAELAGRVKDGAKSLADPIMTINIQLVEMNDKTATVVRVMRVIGDYKIGGSTSRMRYTQVARDTWLKQEKGWANKATHELYSEAALDGKLVPLSQIGGK